MSSWESHSAEPLVEPLTRREREILALLAQGYSGPEIAEQLTLAVSSVKWHIQQVYGKLGVNSKRQALTRAKELGLLGTPLPTASPKPSPNPKHNLPLQVTRFFGRETEIAQLQERLGEYRLVTLTGSGGVGKSRLSLQVAEAMLDDFADGVWFVGLAPLTDPELVPQQVAASLGLRDEPGRPILDSLTDFLRPRQVLLVLDNCEHLLDACARLAEALLHVCPRLKILASSREPLSVAGEAVFAVPSLPFPDSGQALSPEQLNDYAAVRLFVDRAHLVLPDYRVAAHNAASVARICQRLDGIPLALELAAARLRLLNTETLTAQLDDVFRVLTSGSRTALPRHQTLRATVEWSYQLLSEAERLLLQRLSVFAGGCTLEAAEAVCSGDGLEASEIMDRLAALVDKSMVIAERQPGEEARYRLLEMVRQYAQEKLEAARERAGLHTRHRDYFLAFTETRALKLQTSERFIWEPKLVAELDNVRQALEWSFSDLSEVEAGPRLLIAMRFVVGFRHQEALDWYLRSLALCQSRADISASLHVELLGNASALTAMNDPQTAVALSKQAIEISRSLGPEGKETLMWRLKTLAHCYFADADEADRAVALLAEAESILQALGPTHYAPEEGLRVKAIFSYERAALARRQGRYRDAKQHASESIRLYEESGSHSFAARAHTEMGIACLHLGEYREARERFLVALILNREIQGWEVAYNLRWLAAVDIGEGNLEQALEYGQESMREADKIPDRNIIASNLGLLAAISAKQGQSIRAACLAGASAAMWARQKRKPWEDSSLDTLLSGWRDGPEHELILHAFEVGQAMSADEAVAYALGLEPLKH